MVNILSRLNEIVKYRHLLFNFVLKEFKVRYKSPILGLLWAFIVPFSMALIFILVFSFFLKVPDQGYPFFLFLISALFPWNYLNLSLNTSVMCLLDNAPLIKKVYFPREIIPLSIVLVNLSLFLLSLSIILIFMVFFGIRLNLLFFAFLPLVVLMQTLFVAGLSLGISSLQVKYRDIKYIVELLLVIWFYLTPIFYPLDFVSNISALSLNIFMLNPLAQLFTFYRIIFIAGYLRSLPPQVNIITFSLINIFTCLVTFIAGLIIFKRQEKQFIDLL